MLYNDHKAVTSMIENHFHINNCRSIDDLSEKEQRQLANLVIQDFDHFDPADILLYKTEPDKNIITYLEKLNNQQITEKEFINHFYTILIEGAKLSINEIFDEVTDKNKIKEIEQNWPEKMDAILGFI